MKVLIISAIITLLFSGSFLAGYHSNAVRMTPDKYRQCISDPYVNMVSATEMMQMIGAKKTELLEQLNSPTIDKETRQLAKKAVEWVYDQKHDDSPTVLALINCFNK